MTIFNEDKATDNQGAWFKFQTSHKDESINDKIEAYGHIIDMEKRHLTPEELKEVVELSKNLFIFDDPDPNAAEFCIRETEPFFTERLKGKKKKREFVFNPSSRAMDPVSYYPDQSFEEQEKEKNDCWDYMITGIRNAFLDGNKPIECNRENKIKFMEGRFRPPGTDKDVFSRFANKCLRTLAECKKSEADAAEKN